MNEAMREHDPPSLAAPDGPGVNWAQLGWGLAILTFGLVQGLDRLDLLYLDELWRYAPMIMIAFGLLALLRGKGVKGREGGWWLTIGGTYLLVNFLQLWGFSWGDSWPLILVMIGCAMWVDPKNPEERWSSFWLLGIGAVFLIGQGRFFGLDFSEAWPVLLIAAGLAVTLRSLWPERVRGGGQ